MSCGESRKDYARPKRSGCPECPAFEFSLAFRVFCLARPSPFLIPTAFYFVILWFRFIFFLFFLLFLLLLFRRHLPKAARKNKLRSGKQTAWVLCPLWWHFFPLFFSYSSLFFFAAFISILILTFYARRVARSIRDVPGFASLRYPRTASPWCLSTRLHYMPNPCLLLHSVHFFS